MKVALDKSIVWLNAMNSEAELAPHKKPPPKEVIFDVSIGWLNARQLARKKSPSDVTFFRSKGLLKEEQSYKKYQLVWVIVLGSERVLLKDVQPRKKFWPIEVTESGRERFELKEVQFLKKESPRLVTESGIESGPTKAALPIIKLFPIVVSPVLGNVIDLNIEQFLMKLSGRLVASDIIIDLILSQVSQWSPIEIIQVPVPLKRSN